MSTYLGRPVEVIEDHGNGITRVKFLDCGKPRMVRHSGESAEEYVSRIESHGILDVATDRVEPDGVDCDACGALDIDSTHQYDCVMNLYGAE